MVSSKYDYQSFEWFLYSLPKPNIGKSSQVQKGLICSQNGGAADLSEEGLGFGVPVLQYKRDFVFPGTASVSQDGHLVSDCAWKDFEYNLIERHQKGETTSLQTFSWISQRIFNAVYKSNIGRKFLDIIHPIQIRKNINRETFPVFIRIPSVGKSRTNYDIDRERGRIKVNLDFSSIDNTGLQQIYIHNELGSTLFNTYLDSSGLHLKENQISGWDEVHAIWSGFYSTKFDNGFLVKSPKGIRIFRGREVIGSDIRWSGIIFMMPPHQEELEYEVRFYNNLKSMMRDVR